MQTPSYTTPTLQKLERADAISLLREATKRGNAKAAGMLDLTEQPRSGTKVVFWQKKPTSASQSTHERWKTLVASGA